MSVHDVQCRHESPAAPGGRREVGQGDGDAEPRQEAGYRCHQVCMLYFNLFSYNLLMYQCTIISQFTRGALPPRQDVLRCVGAGSRRVDAVPQSLPLAFRVLISLLIDFNFAKNTTKTLTFFTDSKGSVPSACSAVFSTSLSWNATCRTFARSRPRTCASASADMW